MKTITYQHWNTHNWNTHNSNTQNAHDAHTPSIYQNYNWIEPKALVRTAKKGNRLNGIFPIHLLPYRHVNRLERGNPNIRIAASTGNLVVGIFSIMMIIVSLMTMLVAQPQGEIPVESSELEPDSIDIDQNGSGIPSSAQMTDNNLDDHNDVDHPKAK